MGLHYEYSPQLSWPKMAGVCADKSLHASQRVSPCSALIPKVCSYRTSVDTRNYDNYYLLSMIILFCAQGQLTYSAFKSNRTETSMHKSIAHLAVSTDEVSNDLELLKVKIPNQRLKEDWYRHLHCASGTTIHCEYTVQPSIGKDWWQLDHLTVTQSYKVQVEV